MKETEKISMLAEIVHIMVCMISFCDPTSSIDLTTHLIPGEQMSALTIAAPVLSFMLPKTLH